MSKQIFYPFLDIGFQAWPDTLEDINVRTHTALTDIGKYTHSQIDNYIDAGHPVDNHNSLSGLQGGSSVVNQFNHLTNAQIDIVNAAVTSETDPVFLARSVSTGHYTGFPNRTDTTLSWNDANYTLTVSGTFKVYINGTEYSSAGLTKQITDATGLYWFWITASGTTLTLNASTTAPGFDKCLVATVYWNTTTDKGVLSDERHWMGRDKQMHEYLHETVGARWFSGGTISFPTNTTFGLTDCEMYDEDIEHKIAADTKCRIFYKNGSANWEWDDNQTYLAKKNGANFRYNNGNALADVSGVDRVAAWVFATNNTTYPFAVVLGQRTDTTIANARANNTPNSLSLGTLPSAEWKLLYRVLFKNGTDAPVETADYRSVSNVPVINYTATDHSALSNLEWSKSGHTMDTNVNFGGYNITTTANVNAGYFIGNGSLLTNAGMDVWEIQMLL